MKPKSTLHAFLLGGPIAAILASSAHAATFYWDNNGTTLGFGNAGGTWAQNSTSGGTSARWKTDPTGVVAGSATQATANTDIFHFGTTTLGLGAGTITVNAAGVTMGDTFYGSASDAVVLTGGTITFGATKTITVNNASNTINSVVGGAATSLTKAGSGSLLLTAVNTYAGSTIINGGTLDLGGGTATGSLASTVLTLGGGMLSYTRTGGTTQNFTTANINAGGTSQVSAVSGNTLNLDTVARGVGGSLNFGNVGAGTVAALAVSNDATGIMAGLNHGDSWAVANGAGVAISALAGGSYTQSSVAGDTAGNYTGFNIDVNSSQTPDAAITANSLRFSSAAANTLTLQSTNVITSGGILVGSGVGANLTTITGGTLAGAASKDLTIIQNNTSGGLTVSSVIDNSGGATGLTKSGAGLLTLTNSNTFTGGVFVNGGQLILADAGALNSTTPNNVTVGSGGTLTLNGNNLTVPVLSGRNTGAVIENASASDVVLTINSGSNSSFAGVIQNGTGTGKLALTKSGAGTLTLSGANTYTGDTTISAGTVTISNATSLGAGNVLVTGSSRINVTGGLTYANAINVGAALQLQNPQPAVAAAATYSGQLTGSSAITLVGGGGNGIIAEHAFTNTNNTFTGNVILPSGNVVGHDLFSFNSIGDGGVFTLQKTGNQNTIAYTGSANIVFNTRAISLGTISGMMDGGGVVPVNRFANNGTGTVTFNTDMTVTGGGTSTSGTFLFFGGTNTGDNTFAGLIPNTTSGNNLGIGKSDAGKWILTGDNTCLGNVKISGGILSVGKVDLAANAQPLGKGTIIEIGHQNTTGTLEFTGPANSTDKQVQIGNVNSNAGNAGGAIILNNGSGSLTFSNATFNQAAATVTATRTLTLSGNNTGDNTISGVIQDNVASTGKVALTKTGVGTWKLSGNNTYSGGTTLAINGGILSISHANALGTGTVHNATTNSATSGSTLQLDFAVPGAGPGSSTVDPNVIANNFTFNCQSLLGAGGFANIQNVAGFSRIGGSLTITGTGGTGANIVSDAGHLELAGNLTTTVTGPSNRAFNLAGAGNGTVSGVISNGATSTVPITKSGLGTWTLTNANTYTGTTNITGGNLALSSTGSIATSASVTIGAAGTLDTSAQATYTVPGAQPLAFGIDASGSGSSGKISAAGLDITNAVVTYNITGTPDDPVYVLATYTSLTGASFASVDPAPAGYTLQYAYEGNKIALVQTGGPSGYSSWASVNSASANLNDDHDNDGVDNGTEYFLGGPSGNTTGFTALPGVVDTAGVLSVTWPKGAGYTGVYGTDFVVETSATLSGAWAAEALGGGNITDSGTQVKFTFPSGPPYSGKNFARLKVTGP